MHSDKNERPLTLVVHASPAVTPAVLAQSPVVPPGGVVGPLQGGDVPQVPRSKFSFGDSTAKTVDALLQETDGNAATAARNLISSQHKCLSRSHNPGPAVESRKYIVRIQTRRCHYRTGG